MKNQLTRNDRGGIVFLVSDFSIGGIQTLILNLSRALAKNNQRVSIICLKGQADGALVAEVKRYAEFKFLADFQALKISKQSVGWAAIAAKNSVLKKFILSHERIHVTDSATLMFWASLGFALEQSPKLTVAMYHSEEFVWKSAHQFRKIEQEVFSKLSDEAVIFFNSFCKRNCAKQYGRSYSNSNIVPVGIPLRCGLIKGLETKKANYGVFVGRLIRSKTYLEAFIRIIPLVLKIHPDFEFHIFGDGPEKSKLQLLSKDLPVKFFDQIAYSELSSVFSKYKFALGSGTSVLQSSGLGVPSIVGIESLDKPLTYGLLNETKAADYMEIGLDYELKPVYEVAVNVLGCGASEYKKLCEKAEERAQYFCVEKCAKNLFELGSREAVQISIGARMSYYVSYAFWSITAKLGLQAPKADRHSLV